MHPIRRRRFIAIIILTLSVISATGLVLYALKQNINLFYTPTQLRQSAVPAGQLFRIGGIVKNGSVIHGDGVIVDFVITDHANDIPVHFEGILPDLFREGQGIVSLGRLNTNGIFIADQVLAKHGADYKPPQTIKDLKAVQQHQMSEEE